MNGFPCVGCRRMRFGLKSRCLIQWQTKLWNKHCIECCCLNKIRGKPCDDPSGLGYEKVRK